MEKRNKKILFNLLFGNLNNNKEEADELFLVLLLYYYTTLQHKNVMEGYSFRENIEFFFL